MGTFVCKPHAERHAKAGPQLKEVPDGAGGEVRT